MRRLLIAGLLAATALASWAFWWEPDSLVVRQTELHLAHWPSSLDGLRIVHLSDLHVGSPWIDLAKLREVVRLSNAAQPDLIVLTGDYVINGIPGGRFTPPQPIAQELGRLRAPLGVVAVIGNHDWWVSAFEIRKSFEAAGLVVLEDEARAINYHGQTVWLAGFKDESMFPRDWRKALARIPAGEPVIGLVHNPDLFPKLPSTLPLLLAGHTHGGQVRLPLLGRLVVPSAYGRRYAIGPVVEGDKTLFVSPGIGTSILPVRFGVPPEISVLTLRAAPAKTAP